MSQAEELLLSSTGSDAVLLSSNPDLEEHIVIGDDRFITVPESLKRIAVQYDHNIETVTFDCPRYWDGYDMSKMKVCVVYERQDGYRKSYTCKNVVADENNPNIMHFDWTILSDVTQVAGNLQILVCVKKTNAIGVEANHWNSEINKDLYVSEGMEVENSNDTAITVVQGDTFSAEVGVYDDYGNSYEPSQDDAITFTVINPTSESEPLLVKEVPVDTMKLVITPGDTSSIDIGEYVYNVKLMKATGEIYTIISNSSFVLM